MISPAGIDPQDAPAPLTAEARAELPDGQYDADSVSNVPWGCGVDSNSVVFFTYKGRRIGALLLTCLS